MISEVTIFFLKPSGTKPSDKEKFIILITDVYVVFDKLKVWIYLQKIFICILLYTINSIFAQS